jgi:hypothetical protein
MVDRATLKWIEQGEVVLPLIPHHFHATMPLTDSTASDAEQTFASPSVLKLSERAGLLR